MALVTSAAASLKNTWGFSLQSIPGLQLWLDGADTTSMTFSPGTSNVTTWRDKSGNGYNATNSTYAAPTYSATGFNTKYPGLLFNGTSTMLATPSILPTPVLSANGTDTTIFVVFNRLGSSPNSGVYGLGGAPGTNTNVYVLRDPWANSGSSILDIGSGTSGRVNIVNTATGPQIYSLLRSGTSTYFYNYGVSVGSNLSSSGNVGTTSQPLNIGGGFADGVWFNSYISEFIIFNTGLTTPQRQQVEGYLATKWGLKANLPAIHPYSAAAIIPFNRSFYPTDIPGCSLWLDAADFSSMTVNQANSNITVWKDKSGNGRDAVPSVAGVSASTTMNPPVYTTTPYVGASFNSTRQMAAPIPAGTFSTAFSGFVVFNFIGNVNNSLNYSILNRAGNGTNSPFSEVQVDGSVFRAIGGATGGTFASTTGTPLTSTTQSIYYVNVASSANTTWNESVNGTLTVYSTAANTYGNGGAAYADLVNYVNIGGRYDTAVQYNGIISEVICYNFTLTTSERQQVEQYLAWKWGLVVPLPVSHPGKLLPAFSTPFTPKSITGLQLWLDAADPSTITFQSGTNMSQWSDKSGNGNHGLGRSGSGTPVVTTGGPNYVSSTNGITFDSNQFFITSGLTVPTQTHCLIVVHNPTIINGNGTGNTRVFSFQNVGTLVVFPYMDGTTARGYIGSVGGAPAYNNSTLKENSVAGQKNLIVANIAATSQLIFKNGTLQTSGTSSLGAATSDILSIGKQYRSSIGDAYEGYQGTIHEMFVFNTTLTTQQRQQVEGYLAWKWGLQSSLPSTHAYAKFSP